MNGETLSVYNARSAELAEYFRGIGSRVWDIEKAFELAGASDGSADVLELGCGDGRDALAIIPRCRSYVGIDYSEGMLGLAKDMIPKGDFRVADMQTLNYPKQGFDVVFAFAALLHLDKDAVQDVVHKVACSLRPGGIFYISSKHADEYKEERKTDKFGNRLFYFYNPLLIAEMAGGHFEAVEVNYDSKGTAPWFQIGLKKL